MLTVLMVVLGVMAVSIGIGVVVMADMPRLPTIPPQKTNSFELEVNDIENA
jgi:hypothetical protein